MRVGSVLSVFGAALLAGCAATTTADRTRAEDPESFVGYVVEDIEAHEWQNLLAASDPTHYRARVVDAGITEVQYLAELLGLDREGNSIQEGDSLDWSDLDRIDLAVLAPAPGVEGPPFRYVGRATLVTGESLRLEIGVTRVQGRYVLTGPDR